MEQRDTIEKQIEQLSSFLKSLLSKALGCSNIETTEEISNAIQTTFNFDFIAVSEFDDNKMEALINENSLTESHLEHLAELAYILGKNHQDSDSKLAITYFTISNKFSKKADAISGNFSLERNQKQNKINNFIHKQLD
ncbi:hypothetical protein G6N05_06985 [Flavobacterium sp. F372]|jgi:hypothetical protein|uniref:TerB family tellurite resistance protein n=1 Tax=Flavobacterium bernardetii TaxID=2813823 RepID=A0ABR7IXL0_9FLAO|nr:hypothetical protein [Flavobacterium bernardetii]MBC5834510.1 hypothetical protein [Flavobacterium bernardetii]NHF69851.1 hypothetical protein [Flavobacterium bernardetii]